ncbi:isochorismate synthase [Ktedonobacter racemifer]|uniref:isochorismate synthase n=1 Tax=Ktedonobacter racemifer DSM 44963 TaxID=485913 RepID=D6TLZ7_KTERA|nr:isochorismate synthase [Ktedonobacter racemifer]EFH86797.1 isochorismate synthase [Ktedonobacter racemifer DSM 44963]
METVFTDRATPHIHSTHPSWVLACERTQLLTLLQQAATRAQQQQQNIFTALTLPVESRDALHIFSAFQVLELGERFFWEKPASGEALVGVGAVLTIAADSADRFDVTARALSTFQDTCLVATTVPMKRIPAPALFGGFAFDPQRPGTQLWQGFPAGLLTLPQILYRLDDDQASLSIHACIRPQMTEEDLEQQVTETLALLQRLSAIVEHFPFQRLQELSTQTTPMPKHEVLPAQQWISIVAQAVEQMRQGAYQKIVLARAVEVLHPEGFFDVETTLYRLRQSYPDTFVFALQRGKHYFVGATPERLVSAQEGRMRTMALAGSAPRGHTPAEDEYIGQQQLYGTKIRQEHQFVIDLIRESLSELCNQIEIGEQPHVRKLKNIQHLETSIEGRLKPGHNLLEAVARLHPTPAVGGLPREAALKEIRDHEELDRGWYAGPLGWIDTRGNGEFAVALRSALLTGAKATLFAGNGIVASSDPEAEYTETNWKLPVMLRSLGDEE